ncbi:MAG: sigma-70 family RNA polymerase sigma factor [Gemmatimonadaceae bacterium]
MAPQSELTRLLIAARSGETDALGELFEHVYQDLRSSAHRQLGAWRDGDTLSTTVLVHEAYLKLADSSRLDFQDRQHFFAVAARAMRQIIIDSARRAGADKRGGAMIHVDLGAADDVAGGPGEPAASLATDLVALEEALSKLETLSPRLARLVELRFYAGLSVEETAEVLAMSPRTVKRDWRKARAFLFRAVAEEGAPPGSKRSSAIAPETQS